MNPFTETAQGKCPHCKDQLLSIPPNHPDGERRIICPVCTTNRLEEAMEKLRWRPTAEESGRMAE